MFNFPFAQRLEKAQNILIAGAGGGFDIFSGLPLYFNLREQGKSVILANYSFTMLDMFKGEMVSPTMMKVLPSTKGRAPFYFPEWYLTRWFKETYQQETPIYAFDRTGVQPLLKNYEQIIAEHQIDAIVLVDGGTDSLMKGDEDGLGTPKEDLSSITAVSLVNVPEKMLVCLGFGVDHYHGVSNDLTFSAIAEMTKIGAFLGSFSLLEQMPEVQAYRAAAQYVFNAMSEDDVSIVSSSILSALAGDYGDHHATKRTKNSRLWINPLMAIYWFFDLEGLAKRNLLVEELHDTQTDHHVRQNIMITRKFGMTHIKKRQPIPN